MDFQEREDNNGIRFSFNLFPTNHIDAVAVSAPIGCLYTPLKQIAEHAPLPYEPTICRNCHCILNSYCSVDFATKVWTCPICQSRNPLPQSYHEITPQCLPAELHPKFTTVEYSLPNTTVSPPVFLFVVDTATPERDFQNLKSTLLQAIANVPPKSMVGLITFGSLVYIHELKVSDFPRSFVFSGNKAYSAPDLSKLLSLNRVGDTAPNPFILPMEEADLMLNSVIDKLECDPQPTAKGERSPRCTGAAIHLASTLIESAFPSVGGQILVFASGPITKGPGAMASAQRTEPVRQHIDIEKGKAPLTKQSLQFFSELGAHASERNVVVNFLSASFEESGVYEVEPLVLKTGGWLISNENWEDNNTAQSFTKYFSGVFPFGGSDCTVSINCTRNFKVSGCIGSCVSSSRGGDIVSESEVGVGGTTEWKLCELLPSTTLAFYFDVSASKADPIVPGSAAVVQFTTRYRHIASGSYRLRVTTAALQFADLKANSSEISRSFDQEAATVLLAKQAIWKAREEDLLDVVHFVDRTLIRFCRRFGTYNKGDALSFTLSSNISVFPQFLYHFRRSPFMSTFNSSPDYTAFLRHFLLCEDTTNSLFMIQPTLLQYNIDQNDPKPVPLDTSSLAKNCVLLLDTYFKVVVWNGSDVAGWRDAGYANQPQYANIKELMESPMREAESLVGDRFPTPALVSCDQDSSLSRYLVARCNPSTQSYDGLGVRGADNLGTDEPSFSKFFQKLKEISVTD